MPANRACHPCQKPANMPHSISMPRRQNILESLLVFAIFCLQGAWPVPEVNEPYYLGKAIHYWNPQWASSDLFLQTADTHAVFYRSVGWLALLLKPTALAWTIRLVTWLLLAWSWQRLSRAVVPRPWASVLTAAFFVFLLQHYNMAGEWVIGGAEAKGFSFVLVFLALEAMVGAYWNRMWLLLGFASAMHILVGGWAAVAAGLVWLGRNWASPSRRASGDPIKLRDSGPRQVTGMGRASSLIAPLIALLLALPGLLPALLMNRGTDSAVVAQANKIYVFERFSHHLDPLKFWADGFVLPFLLLVGLWLLLWPTLSDSPGARRLWWLTAVAILIALVGLAISLGISNRTLAAGWMRFYWFRLADVAVPLGLALLSVRWFVQRRLRVAMTTVIVVAAFHAADCAVLKLFADLPFADRQIDGVAWRSFCLWATGQSHGPVFPRQPRADKLRSYTDWVEVCRWVSDPENTPTDARFLIPRIGQTFKWYAGRGEVVNWKETPQDAASMVDWWKRIQDVYATNNPLPLDRYYTFLSDAGAFKLQQLGKKYHADYLVTQVSRPMLPLPIAHQNDSFVVYELRKRE
jgi:hypothetical protein